jgi:hypothetical protein
VEGFKLDIYNIIISVILVNAIIFSAIYMLREDPLSPGMLDMFFRKIQSCVFFSKREFIYLKIAQIFNSTTHHILSVGDSSNP